MFPTSKCKGDWDLGLCTTSVLALGEPKRNGKIRFSCHHNNNLRLHGFTLEQMWRSTKTSIGASGTKIDSGCFPASNFKRICPTILRLRRVIVICAPIRGCQYKISWHQRNMVEKNNEGGKIRIQCLRVTGGLTFGPKPGAIDKGCTSLR